MKNRMMEEKNSDKHKKSVAENRMKAGNKHRKLPEILFITSYPPRECGIATYSQDLIKALNNKFNESFVIKICSLENENETHTYGDEINYILDTDCVQDFVNLAKEINENDAIRIVLIQHEFGFFKKNEVEFKKFTEAVTKPIAIVFHTVLPNPNALLQQQVQDIIRNVENVIVMTNSSEKILAEDYGISHDKITLIPHGTHLVQHADKNILKEKYNLSGRKVLSTFGLLSSGKSIETTLDALPIIIKEHPEVLFLIIGKTHPSVAKLEGENYRRMLEDKVKTLHLENHVQFINHFLLLNDLLDYLQLTDVYLFTSKDPNQAVSGTFSYAMSCGCPIISTPIPHAQEFLKNNAGISIDFGNSKQLAQAVNNLLSNEEMRKRISSNGLHKMASSAWENAALSHAALFGKMGKNPISLHYSIPEINLGHIKNMTTAFGMIQFSIINKPDIDSGYTLDDNARALIAMCQHYELTKEQSDIKYITTYFNFIKFCLQPEGYFLNYVDEEKKFTKQNYATNLADSNGRAIWALGYLISLDKQLPASLLNDANITIQIALSNVNKIHSTRAMAFVIKGVYYRNLKHKSAEDMLLMKHFANRLVQMYKHESEEEWQWFESYLTYANSILPEAMLCAWLATGDVTYKEIAKSSFDFLLSKIFIENNIKVISNKGWSQKGEETQQRPIGGEQPIDVAYTILALSKFHDVFSNEGYNNKMEKSFNWFLGTNHLNQIIYNPCTGGCYDGLENDYVNLNQGAESTVSYLMARLTLEKSLKQEQKEHILRKKPYYIPNNNVQNTGVLQNFSRAP